MTIKPGDCLITLDLTFVLKMRGAGGLVQDDWEMYPQEGGMKAAYVLMYNLGEKMACTLALVAWCSLSAWMLTGTVTI